MKREQARIKEQHADLRKETDELLGMLEGDIQWSEVETKLARLAETLEHHFEMEEIGGYLSAVVEEAPEQAGLVRRLRGAHDDLWSRLRQLRHDASHRKATEPFRTDLAAWVEKLQDHESRESALLAGISPKSS